MKYVAPYAQEALLTSIQTISQMAPLQKLSKKGGCRIYSTLSTLLATQGRSIAARETQMNFKTEVTDVLELSKLLTVERY